MNLNTVIQNKSFLDCGHSVVFDVGGRPGETVWCFRCDSGRKIVRTVKWAKHSR